MESRSTEIKIDNEFLPVLILGSIGAGKSTLINYLLGKKIGPAKENKRKMDVTEGEANPAICHRALTSGTKKVDEFKDQTKKISYYDTPPIQVATDDDTYDSDAPNSDTNISQISQLIDQVKEKKGVVIVVVSVSELDGPRYGFIPRLGMLSQKTKIDDCPILFAATKTEGYRDDLTSCDMKDRAIELLKHYKNIASISKKMGDVNNWIAVNMLTSESYQAIHQWIEKMTLQKTSALKESHSNASESPNENFSKNPPTPKLFQSAPNITVSAELVGQNSQKQKTECSTPTNGR